MSLFHDERACAELVAQTIGLELALVDGSDCLAEGGDHIRSMSDLSLPFNHSFFRCFLQSATRASQGQFPVVVSGHLGDILFQGDWLDGFRASCTPTCPQSILMMMRHLGIIDALALQRCCDAVVEQQPVFLQWVMQCLPLEQCLFVMNDTTQAFCWHAVGKQEQWFAIFDDLMAHVKPMQENRKDRFLYMRTAINVHLRSEKNGTSISAAILAVSACSGRCLVGR